MIARSCLHVLQGFLEGCRVHEGSPTSMRALLLAASCEKEAVRTALCSDRLKSSFRTTQAPLACSADAGSRIRSTFIVVKRVSGALVEGRVVGRVPDSRSASGRPLSTIRRS